MTQREAGPRRALIERLGARPGRGYGSKYNTCEKPCVVPASRVRGDRVRDHAESGFDHRGEQVRAPSRYWRRRRGGVGGRSEGAGSTGPGGPATDRPWELPSLTLPRWGLWPRPWPALPWVPHCARYRTCRPSEGLSNWCFELNMTAERKLERH